MPLPITHAQEHLSVAYVKAVAAMAGVKFIESPNTEYGIDVYLHKVSSLPDGRFTETGIPLQCQIKSSTNCELENGELIYDMKADAYNKIIQRDGEVVLVLFRLPKEEDAWLKIDEERLRMRNCCYWERPRGKKTSNTSSVRIRVPRDQQFTPDAVNFLLDQFNHNDGRLP